MQIGINYVSSKLFAIFDNKRERCSMLFRTPKLIRFFWMHFFELLWRKNLRFLVDKKNRLNFTNVHI